MKKITCKICGEQENPDRFYEDFAKHLMTEQLCFTCYHWGNQHQLDMTERGEHGFAIIDGTHYVLEPHTDAEAFRGHGGRNFKIRFSDGYETTCDNLWCQGDIPEGHWRDLMPDNAQFVQEDRA